MPAFRLFNISTERLESHPLEAPPPYLAASHTWSENVFPRDAAFQTTFGAQGLLTVIRERFPDLRHCWFDTLCIEQNDEQDKLAQIPLMDRIYGQATCVVVFINNTFGADQDQVDHVLSKVDGALAMCKEEAWKEEGAYWQSAEGRKWLYRAQQGLLRLASTPWSTRIWTLQEYVLARSVLWIGLDLRPIRIDDYALTALPDICDTLDIEECLTPDFRVLNAHLAGMANARLGTIDRTRIMELPGNRKATEPVDEVYGCMAASGVSIVPESGETRGAAWSRWCAEAVKQGHIRWILLPASSGELVEGERENCIFPHFLQRHQLSSCSGLDSVKPLGPIRISGGCVRVTARLVGSARIVRYLGTVYESPSGRIDRAITLILFSNSKWLLALKIVWAFGGGRYNLRQGRAIAQVLVQSYARAVRCAAHQRERAFEPVISSKFQHFVWSDFMQLQQSIMLAVNNGTAYLCEVHTQGPVELKVTTALILGKGVSPPSSALQVLDFAAAGPDGRSLLMVAQPASSREPLTFHKLGMTLAMSEDIAGLWEGLPLQEIVLGGFDCQDCHHAPPHSKSLPRELTRPENKALRDSHRMRMLERQQERNRFKLFTTNVVLTSKSHTSDRRTRLHSRGLRAGLERTHSGFRDLFPRRVDGRDLKTL